MGEVADRSPHISLIDVEQLCHWRSKHSVTQLRIQAVSNESALCSLAHRRPYLGGTQSRFHRPDESTGGHSFRSESVGQITWSALCVVTKPGAAGPDHRGHTPMSGA